MSYDYIIVIPARLKSTRLPSKPLIKINGIPMIIRTCNQCAKVVDRTRIFVATDSKKILNLVKSYKFNCIMTSKKCKTGTDRVSELSKKIKSEIYINLQGDEPVFSTRDLKKFISFSLKNYNHPVIGMSKSLNKKYYFSKKIPKLVFTKSKQLMYITRAPIPSSKNNNDNKFYRQICIYSFPKKYLNFYGQDRNKSIFEKKEDIEILRLVENDIKVKVIELSDNSISVDTKADIKKVENFISKNDI